MNVILTLFTLNNSHVLERVKTLENLVSGGGVKLKGKLFEVKGLRASSNNIMRIKFAF